MLYNESDKTNICNIYERKSISQILYIILHSYTTSLRNLTYALTYAPKMQKICCPFLVKFVTIYMELQRFLMPLIAGGTLEFSTFLEKGSIMFYRWTINGFRNGQDKKS